MTFNESDVNRDQAGKFDNKTGTAPDQELSTGVSVLNDAAARIREEGVTDDIREAIEPYLDEREDEEVVLALLDVGEASLEANDEEYAWYLADRLGWMDEPKEETATTAYAVPYDGDDTEVIDISADDLDGDLELPFGDSSGFATYELPSDGLSEDAVITPTDAPTSLPKSKPARSSRASGAAPWPVIPPGRFERFLNLIGRSLASSIRFR